MSRVIPSALLVILAILLLSPGMPHAGLRVAAEESDDGPYTGPTATPTPEPVATPSPEIPLPFETAVPLPEFSSEAEAETVAGSFEGDMGAEIVSFAVEYVRTPREPPSPVFSFEELQFRIDDLLTELPGLASVALLKPGEGIVFSRDEARPYRLASVAKLYIMAAYLDRLALEERQPDEFEYSLLETMIPYSDNDAAEYLWQLLGGTEGLLTFLHSRGFYELLPAEDASWGGAADTPAEVARFLAQLTDGSLLDPDSTGLALSLLGLVLDTQRWGVSAGVQGLDQAAVLQKNGWYPEYDGWLVNSAGIVIPANGTPSYVLVILGEGFLYYEDGVDVVEAIGYMANGLMLRPVELAAAPEPDHWPTP